MGSKLENPFLNSSLDILAILGASGYFVQVNSQVKEILGYSPNEFCKIPLAELVHPEDLGKTQRVIPSKKKDGSSTGEVRFKCANGSYKWILWKWVVSQKVIYCCGRDITAERVSRDESARLLAILNAQKLIADADLDKKKILALVVEQVKILTSATGALFNMIVGDEFVLTNITEPAPDMIGTRNKVSVGISGHSIRLKKSIYCANAEGDPRAHKPFQGRFNIQSAIFVPMIHRDVAEGVLIVYSSSKNAFNEGHIRTVELMSGMLSAAISQASEFEAKQVAREDANQAAQAKAEFLANVSHEMRTPLNGIVGMTELLIETSLTSQQKKYSKIIQDSGMGLLAVINDVLDFAKMERGRIVLEDAEFDLIAMIEGARELLSPKAIEKGLEWSLQIDPALSRRIIGDPGRVSQVLHNLLSNAIKFTEKGSITLRVASLSKTEAQERVRFSVQDTGIGISSGSESSLFVPFTQIDGSTARRFGGTGLGLSISKHLVDKMNGKIGVESEVRVGSHFWFELEFNRPAQKAEPTKDPYDSVEPNGGKILVAEDNVVNQLLTTTQLKKLGYHSHVVANGLEAVEAVKNTQFDLVLMDCQMPEMDGYQATRVIREMEKVTGQHTLIVALTANTMAEDRQRCFDSGMDAFIAKPVKKDALGKALEEVFKSKSRSA